MVPATGVQQTLSTKVLRKTYPTKNGEKTQECRLRGFKVRL